ncbi:hypothetical protein BDF19DRAFT_249239 [Syncephalis fuscata]|nr:hypothetical protein BDF19DRAFT_249239 [Syncephalis fuscata]
MNDIQKLLLTKIIAKICKWCLCVCLCVSKKTPSISSNCDNNNRPDDKSSAKYCLFLGWVSSLGLGKTAELLGAVLAFLALLTRGTDVLEQTVLLNMQKRVSHTINNILASYY